MSSGKRLNKRQAREQQELQELASAGQEPDAQRVETAEGSDEEHQTDTGHDATAPVSIFAALGDEVEEEGDDDDEGEETKDSGDEPDTQARAASKKKKNKKKNKKKKGQSTSETATGEDQTAGIMTSSEPAPQSTVSTNARGKKKAAKSSSNAPPTKSIGDMSLDDFDSLLASQPHMANATSSSITGNTSSSTSVDKATSTLDALRATLCLSQNYLDPSVELKRQFGSAAIRAYEASNGGTSGSGQSAARARMMARNPNLKLRSVLVQPREDWPPIARTFTGINGEIVDVDEGQSVPSNGKVATWQHSKAYRAAQYEFQQSVATYDPNAVYALLRPYPWHVHLLSSLSDIAKHQGDLGQASDWNARILFAYERTASTVFVSSLTGPSGPTPVDFRKVENRGLFLAAHRMIAFLGRRGTWRTALEWCKLLLALDPTDPHGSLLWIDFLAIKSKQHKWFVEDLLPKLKASRESDWLGGLAFAEALATRALERENGDKSGEKSTPMLKEAISRHPYFLPALATKIAIPLPDGFADHPNTTTTSVSSFASPEDQKSESIREILAQLYAVRSDSLWKEGDLKDWLRKSVNEAWGESQKGATWKLPPPPSTEAARSGIWRHVIVADMPDALRQQLLSQLPRSITSDSSNLDAYDPLPPTGPGTTRIDDEYFSPLFVRGSGARARSTVPGEAEEGQEDNGMVGRIAAFANQLRRYFQQGGAGTDPHATALAAAAALAPDEEGERQQAMPGGFDENDPEGDGTEQRDQELLRAWMDTLDGMDPDQRAEMHRLFAAGAMAPPLMRNGSDDEENDDDGGDEGAEARAQR